MRYNRSWGLGRKKAAKFFIIIEWGNPKYWKYKCGERQTSSGFG